MIIADIKKEIEQTSAREVVAAAIARAKADTSNAVLETIEVRALERANTIDVSIAAGDALGPLAGIPFLAKDNMLTYDSKTTAASQLLGNFTAPFQAEAIERLEAAGAICIGKVNLDAFAHGGSTENSAFGPTKNPHDAAKVPGGSSGGSAAAVALGIVPFALGTDTGGSIRQPASFCGVVGVKPSYGAVSRYGVVAMASSTDTVGCLANSVADAAEVMRLMAGKDVKDATTIDTPYGTDTVKVVKRIGIVKEWFEEGVSDEVRTALTKQLDTITALGYEVETVSLPSLAYALAVYYVIVPAEIASNLARYDGIRYGQRSPDATTLAHVYSGTRSAGFMPENKRRILIGNYVLSSGYYDAYFKKAARVRTLIVNDFKKAFDSYDVLLGPVAPTTAFALGENTHDPLSMYLSDQMTVSASLAGVPAMSVPITTNGMPVGLQILAPYGADQQMLDFASDIEKGDA